MLRDQLRGVSKEELIQHVLLQRDRIYSLHRRVAELESAARVHCQTLREAELPVAVPSLCTPPVRHINSPDVSKLLDPRPRARITPSAESVTLRCSHNGPSGTVLTNPRRLDHILEAYNTDTISLRCDDVAKRRATRRCLTAAACEDDFRTATVAVAAESLSKRHRRRSSGAGGTRRGVDAALRDWNTSFVWVTMYYVLQLPSQQSSPLLVLPPSRLQHAAQCEQRKRHRHTVDEEMQPSEAALLLSGKRLRRLCVQHHRDDLDATSRTRDESKTTPASHSMPPLTSAEVEVFKSLCCVVIHRRRRWQELRVTGDKATRPDSLIRSTRAAYADERSTSDAFVMRWLDAKELPRYRFDVKQELLCPDHLILFTSHEQLAQITVTAQQYAHMRQIEQISHADRQAAINSPSVEGPSGGARTGEVANADGDAVRQEHGTRLLDEIRPINTPLVTDATLARSGDTLVREAGMPRLEAAFATVAAYTTAEDIKDINDLLDQHRAHPLLPHEVRQSYCCLRCGHLPLVTLTMSCCGAMLCQHCVPTPPTVQGARVQDRLCPICHEEPLTPPQTHQRRDAEVAKLVKEIKVLYLPQLKSMRQRRELPSQLPSPTIIPTPHYLCAPSYTG